MFDSRFLYGSVVKYMKKGDKKGSGVAVLVGGRFNSKIIRDPSILELHCWQIQMLGKLPTNLGLNETDPLEPLNIKRFRYFQTKQLDRFGRRIYEYENKRRGHPWGVLPEYKQNEEVCRLVWKSNKLRYEISRLKVGFDPNALAILNGELDKINKELIKKRDESIQIRNIDRGS